jgi:hypothetical protein
VQECCCGEETSCVPTTVPVVSFTLLLIDIVKLLGRILILLLRSRYKLVMHQILSV